MHTLFSGQRVRERERGEIKRERGREREREGERGREREGERGREREGERDVESSRIFIFIFKRNDGCLGTF
jgi:hypothetical protein